MHLKTVRLVPMNKVWCPSGKIVCHIIDVLRHLNMLQLLARIDLNLPDGFHNVISCKLSRYSWTGLSDGLRVKQGGTGDRGTQ